MEIDVNETFYNIVKKEPKLRELLILYGFEPMKSNKNFETIGRMITMKKALNHVGKSVDALNAFLKEKDVEVRFYEDTKGE